MRFEKVSLETVNRLFRQTKLQETLDRFMACEEAAVRIVFAPGEYANVRSAQSSYHAAIKRLRYPIAAKVLAGDLYLIKLTAKEVRR